MQLGYGENVIPGSKNEIITLEKLDYCYRISSKATIIDSSNTDTRTFSLDFSDKFSTYDVPVMAVLYSSSYENSFGAEKKNFFHGKHEVAQIVINHHTEISFKMKRKEVLKEKHTDCNEKTYWEVLGELLYPRLVENCTNPCYPGSFPSDRLPQCQHLDNPDGEDSYNGTEDTGTTYDTEDLNCAEGVRNQVTIDAGDFYNFKSCSVEEYEGRVLRDNELIPGKQEFYHWHEYDKQDWELLIPKNFGQNENPGNLTMMFSYKFDSPLTMTVEIENYIVTFVDLVGIVGGTLGVFIGFAFWDNILATLKYLIMIFNWVKRITDKKKASKVSDVKMSSKEVTPKEEEMPKVEVPKEEVPKEEVPKEEVPKEEVPKEEVPKEEVPKEEVPKEEVPKEETPKQEVPKEETPKQEMPKEEVPKEEVPKEEVPREEIPKQETPNREPKKEETPEVEILKQENTKEPKVQV